MKLFKLPRSPWDTLILLLAAILGLAIALLLLAKIGQAAPAYIAPPSTETPPPTTAGYRDHYADVWKNPSDTAALSLNFSPYYLPDSDPEISTPLDEETMRRALDAIAPFADTIRTFAVSGEMTKLYQIAKEEYGMRIIAGCWIGANYTAEQVQEELTILAGLGNKQLADILIVGSEGLLRGDYSASDLKSWINDLRGMLTRDVPIGTSDTATALLGYPEVIAVCDVAMYTYYPYFSSVEIDNALDDFVRVYQQLKKTANNTKLICSETGWKFEGKSMGAAIASPVNAARYLDEIIAFSRRENLEICIFEACEEPWKNKYDDDGWALLDTDLNCKPSVSAMLERIVELRRDEG